MPNVRYFLGLKSNLRLSIICFCSCDNMDDIWQHYCSIDGLSLQDDNRNENTFLQNTRSQNTAFGETNFGASSRKKSFAKNFRALRYLLCFPNYLLIRWVTGNDVLIATQNHFGFDFSFNVTFLARNTKMNSTRQEGNMITCDLSPKNFEVWVPDDSDFLSGENSTNFPSDDEINFSSQ